MPRYTLNGYRVREDDDDNPIDIRPASLEFVTTTEQYFTYSVAIDGTGDASFAVSPTSLVVYIDGALAGSAAVDYPTNEEIAHIRWNGGANEAYVYIESAERDDDNPLLNENFTYIFSFGPDPLPEFGSIGAFNAFLAGAQVQPVTAGSGYASGEFIWFASLPATVTPNDPILGTDLSELLVGTAGEDSISGMGGDDTIRGDDGADTLVGGDGDDVISGGASAADLRDLIYGGEGNDSIDGGYGNDELRGDGGSDTIIGGYGADTVIGGDGDDALTGQTWSDAIFGGAGNDFINGGFGHDRLNGGTGADQFYHLGVEGHGSDWIQDYNSQEGDVLQARMVIDDFLQVNYGTTPGAGDASIAEAFVVFRPTGQILWALVDGAAQSEINVLSHGEVWDLLA
ncbi:calcium-binding protein [Pseudooceanicola sp. 502str34]